MNFPVNRPSKTSNPKKEIPSPKATPKQENQTSDSADVDTIESEERTEPIPPPSNPRQYRAIGLIQGQYLQSQEQLTQGVLLSSEGIPIDAVVLGRVISLMKNHLDLTKQHLWVVYPRNKQEEEHLHVQIVGVWEPETLKKNEASGDTLETEETNFENGYFSIRGEVIFANTEEKKVIIKIKQSPRKQGERTKFFKLALHGTLPDKPVHHFWDLKVKLQGLNLTIEEAKDFGLIPMKKKPFGKGGGKFSQKPSKRPFAPRDGEERPIISRPIINRPENRPPLPRPKKPPTL